MVKLLIFVTVLLFEATNGVYNGISAGNSLTIGQKKFIENNGEFPYMASVQIQGVHACGAAIIKLDYVLTAAHCLHEVIPYTVRIRAGSYWKLGQDKFLQERSIKNLLFHHTFDLKNDITEDLVVVKLDRKFIPNNYLRVIKMPKQKFAKKFVNSIAIILGFGRVNETLKSDFLRKASVKIIKNKECMSKDGYIDKVQMCATGFQGLTAGLDGDSGGPLILQSKPDLLLGVLSFSMTNGLSKIIDPSRPSVFVEIAAMRTWIEGAIQELDSD